MKTLPFLEQLNPLLKLTISFSLIAAVGFIDYITGYELGFSSFYVIPIVLTTWLNGREIGVVASLASAIMWFAADAASGHLYSHPLIPVWNTLIRFSFFVIITLLLAALRRTMERERKLARVDGLTGAVNSRFFFELAQMEIDRLTRYKQPFTLVYLDLDNFKQVNDQHGHTTGDKVLYAVVKYTRENLRKIDTVARLGGDEFALLLPETSQDAARAAIGKLQAGLLMEMQQNEWPVTFSMGILTCYSPPPSTDKLVKLADELMYSVKHANKNALKYSSYTG